MVITLKLPHYYLFLPCYHTIITLPRFNRKCYLHFTLSWAKRTQAKTEASAPEFIPSSSNEICSCPHRQDKLSLEKSFQVTQQFIRLTTVTRGMFGGVKVGFSNWRTLHQLWSMVVVALWSRAVWNKEEVRKHLWSWACNPATSVMDLMVLYSFTFLVILICCLGLGPSNLSFKSSQYFLMGFHCILGFGSCLFRP